MMVSFASQINITCVKRNQLPIRGNQIYKIWINIIIIIYIIENIWISLFPQLMAQSLAGPRYRSHWITSIAHHAIGNRACGDKLRVLLLWEWPWLLWHPAICSWWLGGCKHVWGSVMHVHHLLRWHLLFDPHLLHLLLNLSNLSTKKNNILLLQEIQQ